jgi:nitrogen fixation NifU-like protein
MGEVQEIFIDGTRYRVFEESWTACGEQGQPHFRKPLYRGTIENADGHGRLTGSCGDTLEIFLKFENERVAAASFLGGECASSTICGTLAAELALGKTPDELAEISGEKIIGVLGAFPEEERHCAFLAAGALQEALSDFYTRQLRRKEAVPRTGEA